MTFDFEKYWEKNGFHTSPAVLGLSFKEIAKKAVDAALEHERRLKVTKGPCPYYQSGEKCKIGLMPATGCQVRCELTITEEQDDNLV
jgi:hypothetical protein